MPMPTSMLVSVGQLHLSIYVVLSGRGHTYLASAMSNHPSVVSLLKVKYGQIEPTPEKVIRPHSHMCNGVSVN